MEVFPKELINILNTEVFELKMFELERFDCTSEINKTKPDNKCFC